MFIDHNLQKALCDRIYEKRKPAALQLEQIVRKAVETQNTTFVEGIIHELSKDFAYAVRHPNYRNGGMIGLAAVAIALGQDNLPQYLDDILQPILTCFGDADSRVRYYACESLYNVAKVAKEDILVNFSEIFDALCKLTADVEESVRTGANLVDQLLRDIVVETTSNDVFFVDKERPVVPSPVEQPLGPEGPTIQASVVAVPPATPAAGQPDPVETANNSLLASQSDKEKRFSTPNFVRLLVERMYVLNPATRMFLVQWIMLLDSIPDLELVKYVPEFLEGLLCFMSDTHKEVRTFTKTCLDTLLSNIKAIAFLKREINGKQDKSGSASPIQSESASKSGKSEKPNKSDDKPGKPATSNKPTASDKSLASPKPDAVDKGSTEKPDTSDTHGIDASLYRIGQDTYISYSQIVDILVNKMDLSHDETRLVALGWLDAILSVSPVDVMATLGSVVPLLIPALSDQIPDIREVGEQLNDKLLALIPKHSPEIDVSAAVRSLVTQLENEDKVTRLVSLKWLAVLYQSNKLAISREEVLTALLYPLQDPSDEVVGKDLELMALIYRDADAAEFKVFGKTLLTEFKNERSLFVNRGKLVFLQLCVLLSPVRIFETIAGISGEELRKIHATPTKDSTTASIRGEDDGTFYLLVIQNLNNILLTATELHDFRAKLTQLNTISGAKMFTTLFNSWMRNTVAVLALCLLAGAYEPAYAVLEILARYDISVSTLIQIDRLIQYIEGPVFTVLRLHLLEPHNYPYLYKTLYGLLMVLPQSPSFLTLQTRLHSVSAIANLPFAEGSLTIKDTDKDEPALVDWKKLLNQFKKMHEK